MLAPPVICWPTPNIGYMEAGVQEARRHFATVRLAEARKASSEPGFGRTWAGPGEDLPGLS